MSLTLMLYLLTWVQMGCLVVVMMRLARGAGRIPALKAVDAPVDATIVVPARNEANRVRPLLASLRSAYPNVPVLIVDDQSTDNTAAVAKEFGVRVLSGHPPPAGWVGKPWAQQQGLNAVETEHVLFLDADVVVKPGLIGALATAAVEHDYQILSVAARFRCDTIGEQLLHPALITTLVYRFAPVGGRVLPKPNRTLLNGQCFFARAEVLRELGGFAITPGKLTDDVAFGRAAVRKGLRVGLLDGTKLIEVKMHTSMREVWRESGRSLALRDVAPLSAQLGDQLVLWMTLAIPQVRLATGTSTFVDIACLVVRLVVLAALWPGYTSPRRFMILSPLLDLAAVIRVTWSFLHPGRRWRGRVYDVRRQTAIGSSATPG